MSSTHILRSYRATLIPKGLAAEDVELCDLQNSLPNIRVRAGNAIHAGTAAHQLTGCSVLKVERIEPVGGAA